MSRKTITMKAWAVVGPFKNSGIVNWKSFSDGEEGFEIHRTRRLARGACFKQDGEKVKRITITWK